MTRTDWIECGVDCERRNSMERSGGIFRLIYFSLWDEKRRNHSIPFPYFSPSQLHVSLDHENRFHRFIPPPFDPFCLSPHLRSPKEILKNIFAHSTWYFLPFYINIYSFSSLPPFQWHFTSSLPLTLPPSFLPLTLVSRYKNWPVTPWTWNEPALLLSASNDFPVDALASFRFYSFLWLMVVYQLEKEEENDDE